MNSAGCESPCIHLSNEDIETLGVDAEHHGPSLLVYGRLASWNTVTIHFCPLGACSKDGDSIHSRKVGMTSFATTASLPLCIFHLTPQQHQAIVYLWLLPSYNPAPTPAPRGHSNLKHQKSNKKSFSTLPFSAEASGLRALERITKAREAQMLSLPFSRK